MRSRYLNSTDVFAKALPALDGLYDVYELTSGFLTSMADVEDYDITSPSFYLTNITSTYPLTTEELVANLTRQMRISGDVLSNKDPFIGGAISSILVLCGIVTAGWMLFLLLLLSSNSIPNSLMASNLFFCGTYTAMLVKITSLLQKQVDLDVVDTQEIQYSITFTPGLMAVRSIVTFLIWLSWVDLSVQLTKHSHKKQVILVGLLLSVVNSAFSTSFYVVYSNTYEPSPTPTFRALKILHYLTDYVTLASFALFVLRFSWLKRRFAYHRNSMALAVFCLVTLTTPIIFMTIDLALNSTRSWAKYVYTFSKLCVTVTIWEWLHTIKSLEARYEGKTVLGRKISNDSFHVINDDSADVQSWNSNYIFKTINVVSLVTTLKSPVNLFHRTFRDVPRAKKDSTNEEQVQLYEMMYPTSTRDSNISQDTGISIEAQHPQFDVDHRYLRNTPSTAHDTANPTPLSHFVQQNNTNTNKSSTDPHTDDDEEQESTHSNNNTT